MRSVACVVSCLLIGVIASVAQTNLTPPPKDMTPQESSDFVEQCDETIRQRNALAQAQYVNELAALAKAFQAKGDLESLLVVKKEQDRTIKTWRIKDDDIVQTPEELRNLQMKHQARQVKLSHQVAKEFLTMLEDWKKKLTVQGKIEEALSVKKEIEKIQQRYGAEAAPPTSPSKIDPVNSGTTPPATGLVMHYTFDKSTGNEVLDVTQKNGPATLHNANIVSDSKRNGCVQFAGDGSFVTFPDDNLPMKDSPRTVALWVKTARSFRRQIPFVYGSLSTGGVFGLCNYSPKRVLSIVEWNHLPPESHSGRLTVTNGDWHQAVLVYDGRRTVTLYIDGQADISASRSYATEPSGEGFLSIDIPGHGFEGKVDEFMVFNKALSSAEIKALYQAQKK